MHVSVEYVEVYVYVTVFMCLYESSIECVFVNVMPVHAYEYV